MKRSLRLATWNCCRGAYRTKLARLGSLAADVATLQECPRPSQPDPSVVWFGDNPRLGVAVVVRAPFHATGEPPRRKSRSMFAVRIGGPVEFTLIAVWAQREGTYSQALRRGLAAYRDLLARGPVVLLGDFNSSAEWDARHGRRDHVDLEAQLRSEFGLVSAYHASSRELPGAETRPTHFWRWQETSPYHIDYCYIPAAWVPRLKNVTVGGYHEWADASDHRPVVVELSYPKSP